MFTEELCYKRLYARHGVQDAKSVMGCSSASLYGLQHPRAPVAHANGVREVDHPSVARRST